MNKLKEKFTDIIGKFKETSKSKKIAIGLIVTGVVLSGSIYAVTAGKTKYSPLFTNLDSKDSKTIVEKLEEKKTDYKVDKDNNTILVPEDEVGQLRLQLSDNITNGSLGFELFDQSSQFGMNDSEFKVKYQRALQGELERTIKSFKEVSDCKVTIVMPEDSVFVKDKTEASASVTLILNSGSKLSKEQVKAIVSLVSRSVKNLPKENIEVIDDKMTLLTEGLYDTESNIGGSTEQQFEQKVKYEKYFENKVLSQLEPIYGKNNVKVKINTTLDFDSYKKSTNTKDKEPPIVSKKETKDVNKTPNDESESSPVDNNMTNTIQENDQNTSTHEETITNYDVSGNVKEELVQAPGKVKRITASVVVNNANLSDVQKESIKSQVNGIIGQDKESQEDTVVEGIKFDQTASDKAKEDLKDMKKSEEKEKLMSMYRNIAFAVVGLIITIAVIIAIKKSKKSKYEEEENKSTIDTVIGDTVPKEIQKFDPIDFENDDEKSHLEKEIKKYASDKPDQVAEIVKSWIAKDER